MVAVKSLSMCRYFASLSGRYGTRSFQLRKGFDINGGTWLYAMEQQIAMRGFLALAPRTGQNVAIFIREPLRPLGKR
jgi:hypothetical protein